MNLNLFWSYEEAFDGFRIKQLKTARQILQNILVFVPLGMILVSLFPKRPVILPLVVGLTLSVGTEATQYFFRKELAELDDVFNNGLVLVLGILIMKTTLYFIKAAKDNEKDMEFSSKGFWIVLLALIAVNASYLEITQYE